MGFSPAHRRMPAPHILVVDDQPINVQLLKRKLEREGIRVTTASSGAEALESIRSERPDLILLDVMMPDMDGLEVCTRLQSEEQTRGIPVIFTQYAHRRWLWEQGWESMQLWLAGIALVRSTWGPWVEAQVVRPVAYVGRRLQSALSAFPPNRNPQRPNRHCPLCRCGLAATAVVMQAQPCGHLYCYVCLYRASTGTTTAASDATHSKAFSCHVCGTVITTASQV